ncbi:hypothetical protein F7725_016111 [Dissostichus mawsoni]|uniref:Uncharacterized protein n=1 Tax=Dissostichus mawsoni TaxID=36200 RepID=A0A7J5Y4K6_DISMA|nr:hypothetical protein F7725_016111 [Dissostichus mawsoni]
MERKTLRVLWVFHHASCVGLSSTQHHPQRKPHGYEEQPQAAKELPDGLVWPATSLLSLTPCTSKLEKQRAKRGPQKARRTTQSAWFFPTRNAREMVKIPRSVPRSRRRGPKPERLAGSEMERSLTSSSTARTSEARPPLHATASRTTPQTASRSHSTLYGGSTSTLQPRGGGGEGAGDSSLTSKLDQDQWTLQQGDVCEWCVSQSEGEEVKALEEVGQMEDSQYATDQPESESVKDKDFYRL